MKEERYVDRRAYVRIDCVVELSSLIDGRQYWLDVLSRLLTLNDQGPAYVAVSLLALMYRYAERRGALQWCRRSVSPFLLGLGTCTCTTSLAGPSQLDSTI